MTIGLGLYVHVARGELRPDVRDVLGDTLWAAMMAWWMGAVVPGAPLILRGACAYGICVMVEISQSFHAPALDAVRDKTLGQLVLGSGFDPRDLAAYALGVAAAVLAEAVVRSWSRQVRIEG